MASGPVRPSWVLFVGPGLCRRAVERAMTVSDSLSFRSVAAYRWTLAAIYGLGALATAWGLSVAFERIEQDTASIAHERGSVLFRLIEITRDWNAQHGGVYVPVTPSTPPNPYLDHPRRDVTTTDGQQFTLINPAYMTRQIAEIAEKADGARFHITSVRPLRPANSPDPWESESLRMFETAGLKERLGFFLDGGGTGGGPVHRFMAPLVAKAACLPCHEHQGYRVGDIRGGISVTMPATALLAIAGERRQHALLLYGAAYLLLAGLGHLVTRRTRAHLLALDHINRGQEAVIAERTRDLHAANHALEIEVAEAAAAQRDLDASRARYRAVVESSQSGVVVVEDGQITFINDRMVEIMGYPAEQLCRMGLAQWAVAADRQWLAERQRALPGSESDAQERRLRLLHRDGVTIRHVDVQARSHRDPGGALMLVASFVDRTGQLQAEQEQLIAAAVFGSAAEAIVVTDKDNHILRVNPAFTDITGYQPSDVLGRDPRVLGSARHDPAFFAEMWRHLVNFGRWEGEVWNRRKNNELYVAWLAITTVQGDALQGRHVATFTNITRRKEAEEIILHRANFDGLTNLPNRSLFDDRLARLMASARRHHRRFALMYLDLDHFKGVNDQFGHGAGDEVLVEASRRMERCVRDADTVARVGGDEFAVILSDLDDGTPADRTAMATHGTGIALDIALRMNRALEAPYLVRDGPARLSASIGLAIFPDDGDDEHALKQAADRALYAAKAGGRNTCRMASGQA
jgi:diguanylate cyclase (GGDEF)-like protein/PAS domain S-box-containing protein